MSQSVYDRPHLDDATADNIAVQRGIVAFASVAALLLVSYAWQRYGATRGVLLLLGVGLGVTLYHARFGFTSAWRQLVTVGQGRGLQAHTLMLASATVLFAPLLARGTGFNDIALAGYVAPINLGLFVGALLFGIGMQLGGACASGTLYATGAGHGPVLITLASFIGGSTIGVRTVHLWWADGPLGYQLSGPVSFANTRYGYAGGVAITLAGLLVIAVIAETVRRRRHAPPIAPVPTATGFARIIRGSWPLWVGALVLAGLNALVLYTSGRPWGVTGAFRLWGAKLTDAFGIGQPATWPAFANSAALENSIFLDNTSVTNIGIIVGALLASALAGTFTFTRNTPKNVVSAHTIGGLLMGYGAAIGFGCNIGAYFSGIASLSLHGWLWGVLALAGTFIGVRLRPLFSLANPTPTDSVC
jgi:uncharacterized membrane protein YedE/YeeE